MTPFSGTGLYTSSIVSPRRNLEFSSNEEYRNNKYQPTFVFEQNLRPNSTYIIASLDLIQIIESRSRQVVTGDKKQNLVLKFGRHDSTEHFVS